MYDWRRRSNSEREFVVKQRKAQSRPWHAPPHFDYAGENSFIITAACFEHQHVIGGSPERMSECESALIEIAKEPESVLFAWCVLPNHYHLLLRTGHIKIVLKSIGRFHGSSSFRWNGEDNKRGRKVWYRCVERSMQSERHFKASLNYIHNNPVKHGYVKNWQDWPYSSAAEYIEKVGRDAAIALWREFPVLDYGQEWDPA